VEESKLTPLGKLVPLCGTNITLLPASASVTKEVEWTVVIEADLSTKITGWGFVKCDAVLILIDM